MIGFIHPDGAKYVGETLNIHMIIHYSIQKNWHCSISTYKHTSTSSSSPSVSHSSIIGKYPEKSRRWLLTTCTLTLPLNLRHPPFPKNEILCILFIIGSLSLSCIIFDWMAGISEIFIPPKGFLWNCLSVCMLLV